MLKLKLIDSHDPTLNRELDLLPETMLNGECFIGRSPKCSIVLPSSEVSRVHASIYYESGQYYFTDLASLTGSRINDETARVNQKYPLRQNDIVRIGEFILSVATGAIPNEEEPKNGQEVPAVQPQQPAYSFAIPQSNPATTAPSRSPSEYMPVALVPPEQFTRWVKGELTVRCIAVIDETHDVKTFRFVAAPTTLFTYHPGQFVTLNLDIDGKSVKRSYSISSTPSRPHTLEITVKRVPPSPDTPDSPPGLVSNWLHDRLKVGSQIKLSSPSGKFTCFANPCQKLLLISAGSGITPMMSMSRWISDTAADCDVVFFHSARAPRDIIFYRELELMAARNPQFRLAIATTRPEPGQPWWGYTGRLNEQMLSAVAPDFWQRTVYVCGPNTFMKGVKAMLEQLDFPMHNYYEESFGGAKKPKQPSVSTAPLPAPTPVTASPVVTPPATEPVAPVTLGVSPTIAAPPAPAPVQTSGSSAVVFTKSGKEVTCGSEASILDLAEQEGVELDSSCRSGVCGTCKVRKLEGEVKYDSEPEALDEGEQEEGFILACVACPVGRVKVDA